jgi:hypothetical protein
MKKEFHRLIKNIEKLQKLPLKRYTWVIEMAVLNLDCELCNFISKYEKNVNEKNKKVIVKK